MDIFIYIVGSVFTIIYCFYCGESELFYDCLSVFGFFCIVFVVFLTSTFKHEFPVLLYTLNIPVDNIWLFFPNFLEIGVDNLSYFFIGLTILIFYLSIYYSAFTVTYYKRFYVINLLLLFICLIILFSSMNLFLFYFVFEVSLLPMFFLIGIWGTRMRRISAAMFFFMYSVAFSTFFLFLLLVLWYWFGSF